MSDELSDTVVETERLYNVFIFHLNQAETLNQPETTLKAMQRAFSDFSSAKGHICHHLDQRIKRITEFKNKLTEFPGFPVVQNIVANIQEQLQKLESIIERDKWRLNNFRKSEADGEKLFDEYLAGIADNKLRF